VAVAAAVDAPVDDVISVSSLDSVLVPMPTREKRQRSFERLQPAPARQRPMNYLVREARNASLGRAGELFALEIEHRRLWEAGARELANRIAHVSSSRGDGLGYDILSFEATGRERLIEVKTTRFGERTPFFASSNEVNVSADNSDRYALYRVFDFRAQRRLFIVPGAIRDQFGLEPVQFRASVA
jgi:hypothetical protein